MPLTSPDTETNISRLSAADTTRASAEQDSLDSDQVRSTASNDPQEAESGASTLVAQVDRPERLPTNEVSRPSTGTTTVPDDPPTAASVSAPAPRTLDQTVFELCNSVSSRLQAIAREVRVFSQRDMLVNMSAPGARYQPAIVQLQHLNTTIRSLRRDFDKLGEAVNRAREMSNIDSRHGHTSQPSVSPTDQRRLAGRARSHGVTSLVPTAEPSTSQWTAQDIPDYRQVVAGSLNLASTIWRSRGSWTRSSAA